MKRIVSATIITILITSMLVSAFRIPPAQAAGTIYIRADGSVDPPEANIESADNVTYNFKSDIYDSIVVERENIIVDGKGYKLQGTGAFDSKGVSLSGKNGITIMNAKIAGFGRGICLNESSNNTLSGNVITASYYNGIYLLGSSDNNIISANNVTANNQDAGIWVSDYSNNNTISDNSITKNWYGIWLSDSAGNTLSDNIITANKYEGMWLSGSSDNTFRNNTSTGNKYDLEVVGWSFAHYVQDIDDSNRVEGKPVCYWVSKQDLTVPTDAGYVGLVNCTNVTAQNLVLTNNGEGILLASTTQSTITKNKLTNNYGGISLFDSSNNSVSENDITSNWAGIIMGSSLNNTISRNDITANANSGIELDSSSNNSILENSIINNGNGVSVSESSNYNIISTNNITANNYTGIILYGQQYMPSNNSVYHNDFVNNAVQAVSSGSVNSWNDGYASGGNYWSDYTGADSQSGLYQNETGTDGIGDTPYAINSNNSDHYPLMGSYCAGIGWRNSIMPGDILLCSSPGSIVLAVSEWTHAGIYVGTREGYGGQWVVESLCDGGVQYKPIMSWDYPSKIAVEFRRVYSGLGEDTDSVVRAGAVQFAKWQVGKPYPRIDGVICRPDMIKHYFNDTTAWYCTELVWAAYLSKDVNLDGDPSSLGYITPDAIHAAGKTVFVNGHLERTPHDIQQEFFLKALITIIHSPVDVTISDPDGEVFNNETTGTLGGFYTEYDADNGTETVLAIPERKTGTYQVGVVAKPDADPTETYTLEVLAGSTYMTIAEKIPISRIPSEPYIIKSTNDGISQRATFSVQCGDNNYEVIVSTNSTLAQFNFNQSLARISYNVQGENATMGYCNVTIPKQLLWATAGQWQVFVNGTLVSCSITNDVDNSYVYFDYAHSIENVQIQGTGTIPEFSSILTLPIFMLATLAAVIAWKRKRLKLS